MAAKKKITWPDVVSELKVVKSQLAEQNFWIDVSYRLYQILKNKTAHRKDLNIPAISTYWGNHILQHYILNDYDLKLNAVFFELEYYSYLNLIEIIESNAKIGQTTYIVDLITDSTDVKTGDDLEEWGDENSFFKDAMKDLWNEEMLEIWQDKDMLVTRKKKDINLESYWNYEDYIFMLTVFDPELNAVVIFLLGTFSDYMNHPNQGKVYKI